MAEILGRARPAGGRGGPDRRVHRGRRRGRDAADSGLHAGTAFAKFDPVRAEQAARDIADDSSREAGLAEVAVALARHAQNTAGTSRA